MWNLLLRNKRWPLGIDIGTDSIRMLQMRGAGGALSVWACGQWRFPESVRDDAGRRKELAIDAVREMLKNERFRGNRVVSSLSCEQLSIKSIRLPHVPDNELPDAVRWEAQERFGFEIGPGQLSYINAGQVRQGAETRDEIILIATPREEIQSHLDLLNEMGLSAEHIDAQPVALFRIFERFLRRQADQQIVNVIVDLGTLSTRIVVSRGRQIVFIRNIDVGGRKFTEAVAKQLNLSYEEAGDLRMRITRAHLEGTRVKEQHEAPDAPDEEDPLVWSVRDAVRGEVEKLARELSLCLRYCAVTFRGLRADRITLTGGEAYDPAVIELFKQQLKVECAPGQPLKGIDVSAVDLQGDRRGMLAEWAVCAGLAIRNIDVKQITQEGDHEDHRLSA